MDDADETPVATDPHQGSDRAISDAETLRALADPLRLRILSILMQREDGALPVMSVKEIAASLGEPQTKLYRHVKHLEAAGLLKAVSSRVVSGIVEHRYQACQSDLMLGAAREDRHKVTAETEAAATAVLEWYRSRFFAAYRASLASARPPNAAEPESYREAFLSMSVVKVPPAKAAEIRERLKQLVNDLNEAEAMAEADGADTVAANVLLGYFSSDAGT